MTLGATGRTAGIDCVRAGPGWRCVVTVEGASSRTTHEVSVSDDELRRYAPGHSSPEVLVSESFRFLLQRESNDSILRRFALSEIESYFPEYRSMIGRLLSSGG